MLIVAPTLVPAPTAAPVELSAADAEALLHENAARVRDEFIRNAENCRFTYSYAGLSAVREGREGWEVERHMTLRDGRTVSSGSSTSSSHGGVDAARIPEYGPDNDYDPVEWFGAEYQSLVDGADRGTYAGRSTYFGQPALRYETRVEREDADMPASALIVTDHLVENPYVFIENEYSANADGTRQLERQFMRYRFELTHCTAGGGYDAAAVAVWRALAEKAADVYTSIRDGLLEGCEMTFREDHYMWLDFRGDPLPGGSLETEVRYVIARNDGGSWQVTPQGVARQGERIVGRTTPEGIWMVLDPWTGEWTEQPPVTEAYEDPFEFLSEHIAGLGYARFVDEEGLPLSTDDGQHYHYPYAGKTEVDGRPAVRYEKVSTDSYAIDPEDGLRLYVEAHEFLEDNPLLFRRSDYLLLPDGEIQPYAESRVEELGLQDCPGA